MIYYKGHPFDWGKTSSDYAKYRDIYPQIFFQTILDLGLCKDGQKVLNIGTGTGVLPRNMYRYGAQWAGTDIAENQIVQAKRLAEENDMKINFLPVRQKRLIFRKILLISLLPVSVSGIRMPIKPARFSINF